MMPADVVDRWLHSGRSASIQGMDLRPVEHSLLKGTSLSVQRGQAEAFALLRRDKARWMLKKFNPGREPESQYLESVGRLLPKHEGFRAGTQRYVLSTTSITNTRGYYYVDALARWLHGAVLMPTIAGKDWAAVADTVRDGTLVLGRRERILLCRNLATLVGLLEHHQCVHRDLTSGNTFFDASTCMVSLIDFDSLYHPSLAMPSATTCGTVGYTAPYVWRGGQMDPQATWRPHADRYALGLLNVEILVVDKGSPLTFEGGLFDQDELRARCGAGLQRIRRILQAGYADVVPLFDTVLNSRSFDGCPSPEAWCRLCDRMAGPSVSVPRLRELEGLDFGDVLKKRRPAATPRWAPPRLTDLPSFIPEQPRISVHTVPSFTNRRGPGQMTVTAASARWWVCLIAPGLIVADQNLGLSTQGRTMIIIKSIRVWPLVIALWVVDTYILVLALRVILDRLGGTRVNALRTCVRELTEPIQCMVQQWITSWRGHGVAIWVAWLAVFVAAVVVRQLLIGAILALS